MLMESMRSWIIFFIRGFIRFRKCLEKCARVLENGYKNNTEFQNFLLNILFWWSVVGRRDERKNEKYKKNKTYVAREQLMRSWWDVHSDNNIIINPTSLFYFQSCNLKIHSFTPLHVSNKLTLHPCPIVL